MATTCVATLDKSIGPAVGGDYRHQTYYGKIAIPAYGAANATATLTSDGTLPLDGDTVTLGSVTYTFRTALTTSPSTIPNEVLIGVSAATALDNLKLAVDAGATEGTEYSTGTTAQGTAIDGSTNTDTTQVFVTGVTGANGVGNSYVTRTTSAHLSFGGAYMTGGRAATSYVQADGITLSFAGVCPHNDPPVEVDIWSDTLADGYTFEYVTGTTNANGKLFITGNAGTSAGPFISIANQNTPAAVSGDAAIRFKARYIKGR